MQNQMHDIIKEWKIIASLWNKYYCYRGTENWAHVSNKQSYKNGEVLRLGWLDIHFEESYLKKLLWTAPNESSE